MSKKQTTFATTDSNRHQSPATFGGEGSQARLSIVPENADIRDELHHSDKENQSQHSFGAGSFSTGTFNNKLNGAPGMNILKYIQSEEFGKFGESMQLIDTIQVSNHTK